MPLEDAMKLVARNFDAYLKDLREKQLRAAGPPTAAPMSAAAAAKAEFTLPDAETHYLLNLLADNRFLSIEELDTVLRYLDDRRDRLATLQGLPTKKGEGLTSCGLVKYWFVAELFCLI